MAAPTAGVDFDRNRLSQGELIAGIAGFVLLIDLWFKWYGVKVSGGGGLLKGFDIGVSATAWQVFSLIDIILFLVALIAIGVAVMRALNQMPSLPYPPATVVAAAGGLAVLLILFRIIDTPVDTHGVNGIDITRKFGLWLGFLAAIGVAYGGWRAMQASGASFGGGGARPVAATPAPTTPMPASGGGAAPATPPAADPVPGQTSGQTPPGLAGEPPPAGEETRPPGL